MVPIPPLDGSHFLRYATGMSEEAYLKLAQWGFLIILVLINLPPFQAVLFGLIRIVVTPFAVLMQVLANLL
jgi:Zn-dependent protease